MCIWHLADSSASKRFHQFIERAKWKRHISSCIHGFIASQTSDTDLACPDPRCPLTFNSKKSLWYHLDDVHSIPTPAAGDLTKLDAKRLNVSLQNQIKTRFVGQYPRTPSYPDLGDAFCSADKSSEASSASEETGSLSTESLHGSQTTSSEYSFEFLEAKTCPSPGEHDVSMPLVEATASEDPPVDPMLLETDPMRENRLSPCLDGSMQLSDGLLLFESASPSADDAMQCSEDTCLPNESSPLPEGQYRVDKLLGKWSYRGKVRFYLRWEGGAYSFELEEDVAADMRRDFDQRDFTGFHEGARIIKWTKTQKGEAWYLVAFEGCTGDWAKWELPDRALHPDLVRPSKPALPRTAKRRRRQPQSSRF